MGWVCRVSAVKTRQETSLYLGKMDQSDGLCLPGTDFTLVLW